jgi:hypothetical protein
MRNKRKCPSCGRQIYQYAQICPYCKGETHFSSFDEEMPQEEIYEEPAEVTVDETNDEGGVDDEDNQGKLGKYMRHLKEDTEKVKQEYEEKIGSRYSASTIVIGSVITLLSIIVLGIFISVKMMETETFRLSTSVDNELKAVIDSMETELYQSSTIVAKFPDRERHSMVYLRDGHLHVYDAASLSDKEIDLQALNSKAVVDYEGSGVLNAYLSTNEKYIIIIASRNSGNTEFGFYRLTTAPDNPSLEVIDRGRVVVDKDGYKVSTDVRSASYDANGDRVSGLSSADWEKVAPKVEKQKKPEKEEKVEKKESEPVKATEQIEPRAIEVAPKPVTPTAPEKMVIKPVEN